MSILFVCTGNTCRSPMAKALANDYFAKQNLPHTADSCGLFANENDIASENAILALENYGIDLSTHRSKPITIDLIDNADVIIPMTLSHKQLLLSAGVSSSKIEMLGEVPDPFSADLQTYRECAESLKKAITEKWK